MKPSRLALLLLLLGGAAILLWPREPQPGAPGANDTADHAGRVQPDLLTAEGDAVERAPGLQPREVRPDASAADAAERGPVRVRVVGPSGTPIPGVYVQRQEPVPAWEPLGSALLTDARGEAVFGDVAYDGSVVVGFYRNDPHVRRRGPAGVDRLDPWAGGQNRSAVTGPNLLYRADRGLNLTVRVVAADTGADVAGARLSADLARDADARSWASAPRTFLVMPALGRPSTVAWKVEPLDGWIAWERRWLKTNVSPYAEALEAVYPLRRELAVTVLPLEAEGGAAPARVVDVTVAGRAPRRWSARPDPHGRLEVTGVPFLRDEILDLRLCRLDRTGPVRVRAVLPDHPAARVDLEVVMPQEGRLDESSVNEAIGIGGGSRAGSFPGRRRKAYENAVIVLVARRDGRPAARAEVRCGPARSLRTDERGRVRFEDLTPGEHRLVVESAGLLPMARTVTVPEGGEVEVELKEGPGGALDVIVVDDDHGPLSFASLEVKTPSGLPWIDMPETVQRVDPFTDALGRRRMTHLEPGTVEITASWGSRKESVKVDVKEAEASAVFVVLPRPRPPR